jgi:hypothetical protein
MGSLRRHLQKRQTWHKRQESHERFFLHTLPSLLIGSLFLVGLVSCVPATTTKHLEFFFSEDVWGGSPFDEAQKKQLFVAALKTRGSESISKDIPFALVNTVGNDDSVTVKRFAALYEVDANLGLPKVRSGYVLELALGSTPPERITLINTLTGVSWAIKLTSSPLVTENN